MITKKFVVAIVFVCCLIIIACNPSDKNPAPKTAETAATSSAVWSMDSDCASCHTKEAATLTNDSCLLYAHSDLECTSCHIDDDKLALSHKDMSADTSRLRRLKRTTVGEETCVDCHGTWEELSELTKESTLVKDTEGTVVNPHTVTTVINKSFQHDRITCTSCHQMHTETTLETNANSTCATCHHQNVYTCGTCHD